jgi:transcriptional regulator with XRE-family HTH domain
MDERWFKQQQKKVGVTADAIADKMGRSRTNVSHILNGRQRMTLDWAKAFAEVLQVPLATVLEKAGYADPATAQQITPGFAESDAAPFTVGPSGGTGHTVQTIAEALGGGRPGVDVWRVKTGALALAGYLPGDFLLVDQHAAERVRAGDVVVAQVYQRNGTATTVLRRFEPPVLVAASCLPEEGRVHVVDGVNVVIRGKITASWRA